jgi:hypothetical protein
VKIKIIEMNVEIQQHRRGKLWKNYLAILITSTLSVLSTIPNNVVCVSKVKQYHYTPWRRLGGEELYLLLILDLGTRWT